MNVMGSFLGSQRHASGSRRRILLLTPFVLLASCAPAVAQVSPPGSPPPQEKEGTIQVSGQAQIRVPADQVRVSFAVETEASTAAEATSRNADLMDSVIGALRAEGTPQVDIQTFGYELRPEYEVDRNAPGTRTISGYRVLNNISVTLHDLQATGELLDRAIQAGANRISNLQFSASDTRQARLQALGEAVASAREQAEAIASAMGVGLGPALEVQGGANAPNPRTMPGIMLRAAAEVTTPVEAGEQMVTANVTITYRIVERAP